MDRRATKRWQIRAGFYGLGAVTLVAGLVGLGPAAQAASARAGAGAAVTSTSTGMISGIVTGANSGTDLAGVCVAAVSSDGRARSTISSADGSYTLRGLTAGAYLLELRPGCALANPSAPTDSNRYAPYSRGWVVVRAGRPSTDVDAALPLAGATPRLASGDRSGFSGTVTAASDGDPLGGICALAVPTTSGEIVQATTEADGTYLLPVKAGTYEAGFEIGCGNTGNYAPYTDPNLVTVKAGAVTPGIDAALQPGAIISGRVTAAGSGKPLGGMCVLALDESAPTGGEAATADNGTYEFVGVPAGSFQIQFGPGCPSRADYAPAAYPTPVTVTPGSTASGIDAALVRGATIAGRVTAAATGRGLGGICVSISVFSENFVSTISFPTSANGNYRASYLAAGSYVLGFSLDSFAGPCGNSGNYAPYNPPGSVTVTPGSTARVDAALLPGGAIKGKVTARAGGAPLSGICASVTNPITGAPAGEAATSPDGHFIVKGLAAGSYYVGFSTGCGNTGDYASISYQAAVDVTAGSTTTGIYAALPLNGSISGKVTAAVGGAPLQGICVAAFPAGADVAFGYPTEANGTYSLPGLTPGTYTVTFSSCDNPGNYVAEVYPRPVHVGVGANSGHIDGALAPGATVSGTVTATDGGGPIGGICVSAFDSAGNGIAGSATAPDGTYEIEGLPAGRFHIEFFEGCGGGGNYAPATYPKAVAVSAGGTVGGIDAALSPGAAVTGTVTAAAGHSGLPGICVIATDPATGFEAAFTSTGDNGSYELTGLGTAAYQIEFIDECGNPGTYAPEIYPTTLHTVAGQTLGAVDAELVPIAP